MKWDQVEGKWKQAAGKITEKWGKLTDDDLQMIRGKRDQTSRQDSGALRNSEKRSGAPGRRILFAPTRRTRLLRAKKSAAPATNTSAGKRNAFEGRSGVMLWPS